MKVRLDHLAASRKGGGGRVLLEMKVRLDHLAASRKGGGGGGYF